MPEELNSLKYMLKSIIKFFRHIKVLYQHGYFQSLAINKPIGLERQPLPWISYPAINFISNLDIRDKLVFEYGSGYSTLFWAARSKKIFSVEDNYSWYKNLVDNNKHYDNINVYFIESKDEYINKIHTFDHNFDIIFIDGEHNRFKCAVESVKKLNKNGLIILDNSDHYYRTAEFLRSAGLIQVDMAGFVPGSSAVWTTSFFFSRDYDFKPIDNVQPKTPIGGTKPSEAERKRIEGI